MIVVGPKRAGRAGVDVETDVHGVVGVIDDDVAMLDAGERLAAVGQEPQRPSFAGNDLGGARGIAKFNPQLVECRLRHRAALIGSNIGNGITVQ